MDLALICVFGIMVVIIVGLTFGRSAPSGRIMITRPLSDSVDGFGGARGYDYCYAPTIRGAVMPFPVSRRVQRGQTKTFRS